ncbi:MAG: hypothetical protein NW218_00370 [Saprospiraceae bacterium]|nr:hypothetical protein [Saprospiraceae bacterium]
MQALTNNFDIISLKYILALTSTVQPIRSNDPLEGSSIFQSSNYESYNINERALRLLKSFYSLHDNWDGDDALAPSIEVLRQSESLVRLLERTGQKVYHVAPGPNGEIMINLRENGKSAEILFYPNKKLFVLFPVEGHPQQGAYTQDSLTQILEWLHA